MKDYEAQLASVRELLEAEPENEEYVELEKTLKEVVDMTADLLRDAAQAEEEEEREKMTTTPEEMRLDAASAPSPAVVATTTAAVGVESVPAPLRVTGRGASWQPGEMCEAKYSGDGRWYKARIVDVRGTANGSDGCTYVVHFSDYGNSEEVRSDCVRDPVIVKVRACARTLTLTHTHTHTCALILSRRRFCQHKRYMIVAQRECMILTEMRLCVDVYRTHVFLK